MVQPGFLAAILCWENSFLLTPNYEKPSCTVFAVFARKCVSFMLPSLLI